MTNETYNKAQKIQKQIAEFEQLNLITCYPYQRYFLVKPKKLAISNYNQDSVVLCDEGLVEVIRDYSSKRIKELRDELAAL